MAITPASQAGDVSSILITRSVPKKLECFIKNALSHLLLGKARSDKRDFYSVVFAPFQKEINLASAEQGMVQ